MRIRTGASTAVMTGAGLCTALALLLTGCSGSGPDGEQGGGKAKNGDTAPLAGHASVPKRPVPRGDGSDVPADFNGDGHRDLVLNDLVKAPDAIQGDDAGIGIVYGSDSPRGVDPAVRQTLSPGANGAATDGVLPAAFDAAASCDLDGDGYADLVVSTDPPYDGLGRPPVPLQLLFGGPQGITGKAVVLKIPAKARYGNEWPDHPVCGDFDGDDKPDLAVSASAGQVSYLRGPFSRAGAPRAAAAPIPGGGPVLYAPTGKADTDGDGYDDLVHATRTHEPGKAAKGELLLGGPQGPDEAGGRYTFKAVGLPPAPKLPGADGRTTTDLLEAAEFIVTRTHQGEEKDLIALYPSGKGGKAAQRPVISFSTSIFLK
ncbi:FG-GAP repeat domain-containing protein [Streptomyces sp. NPDC058653]|uniref:FG-GAP repeat domain-containing protein n=1 Tax=Streptomyces sp. NPDC058653 TaxID=3346576 RepID=UPI00365137C4